VEDIRQLLAGGLLEDAVAAFQARQSGPGNRLRARLNFVQREHRQGLLTDAQCRVAIQHITQELWDELARVESGP
jgi:hypothetical protein